MKGERVKTKKKWGKPKLIILTRGKPEEMTLFSCKSGAISGGMPSAYGTCISPPYPGGCSYGCDGNTPS